jgi:hypothetical protein
MATEFPVGCLVNIKFPIGTSLLFGFVIGREDERRYIWWWKQDSSEKGAEPYCKVWWEIDEMRRLLERVAV